jgi:hypothetical protein
MDITYQVSPLYPDRIRVYLQGKRIGTIKPVHGGFAYYPVRSQTAGETLPTVEGIKATLEEM